MEQEKIIKTIKKVLELSKNNPSEEEAKSAVLKAQALLAKYHIDMKDVEAIDNETLDAIGEVKVSVPAKKWKYKLAKIVANNFRCKNFYYGKGTVVFYGHESDANVAADTFKYLFSVGNKCATREVSKAYKAHGTSEGIYNSYVAGFCDGVSEVLGKQCTALMLVVPQDVKDAYSERSKDFGSFHASMRSYNAGRFSNVYSAGKSMGRDSINSRQLEG